MALYAPPARSGQNVASSCKRAQCPPSVSLGPAGTARNNCSGHPPDRDQRISPSMRPKRPRFSCNGQLPRQLIQPASRGTEWRLVTRLLGTGLIEQKSQCRDRPARDVAWRTSWRSKKVRTRLPVGAASPAWGGRTWMSGLGCVTLVSSNTSRHFATTISVPTSCPSLRRRT